MTICRGVTAIVVAGVVIYRKRALSWFHACGTKTTGEYVYLPLALNDRTLSPTCACTCGSKFATLWTALTSTLEMSFLWPSSSWTLLVREKHCLLEPELEAGALVGAEVGAALGEELSVYDSILYVTEARFVSSLLYT
jgi:hypothetical protein